MPFAVCLQGRTKEFHKIMGESMEDIHGGKLFAMHFNDVMLHQI